MISTFAITLVPEFDEVIRNGAKALAPDGRFAILDFKRPAWAPLWVVKAFVWVTAPFGMTREVADRHAWEPLKESVEKFSMEELYLGFSYLVVGRSGSQEARAPVLTARTNA